MMELINFHNADPFTFSVNYAHLLYMNKKSTKLEGHDCDGF
jgi:hypothetical protein